MSSYAGVVLEGAARRARAKSGSNAQVAADAAHRQGRVAIATGVRRTGLPGSTDDAGEHASRERSAAQRSQPRWEADARPAYFDRPLLLVAEDDCEMRRVLWSRLTNAGYRVRTTGDGNEALELLQVGLALGPRTTPVAVVTDLRMAGMGGLELLEHLHKLDPRLPVIAITAFGDPETHAAAEQRGARVCLDKPFEISLLLRELLRLAPPPPPNPAEPV